MSDTDSYENEDLDFTYDPARDLVDHAPAYAVRAVLKQLCGELHIARRVSNFLGKTMEENATQLFQQDQAATHAVCAGCGKHFDEFNNPIGSCTHYKYHPKHVELDNDDDIWVDQDYPPPEEHKLEDLPLGFKFLCCGRKGTSVGCTAFRHVSNRIPGAFPGEQDESDDEDYDENESEDRGAVDGPGSRVNGGGYSEDENEEDEEAEEEEEEGDLSEEEDESQSETEDDIEAETLTRKHELEEDNHSETEPTHKKRKTSSCAQS